jgi:PAS domain S-box-containing protein
MNDPYAAQSQRPVVETADGLRRAEARLDAIGNLPGDEFLYAALEILTGELGVACALASVVDERSLERARTVAVVRDGLRQANFSYDLAGTPCADVVGESTCFYPHGVAGLFPADEILAAMGAEAYWGAPLRSARGDVIGLIALVHSAPMVESAGIDRLLQIYAQRVGAHLERTVSQSINERLGRIVEESASEVYIFDVATYRFILVNKGARDNLGYTLDELRQKTPWDLKPKFSREDFIAYVAPLVRGEVPRLDFETVHCRKDGTCYDVDVKLQILDFGGERVFFAAIQDVSSRKVAEEALRQITRRLNAILNNTSMAVFMMDERQHCAFMNEAAEKLTGFRFDETQGRPLHDVIHHTYPDGRPFPLHECAIDRAFPEKSRVQGETVFIHKDGHFYPVGFTASPIEDEAGTPIGTVIEARNIAEELKSREALASFHEVLQARIDEAIAQREKVEAELRQSQKMEAVGKLTGGIAHDFNNLLQIIGGNLQLLQKDVAGSSKAERRLDLALTGVNRGAKLAAQLLAFGRRQPLAPKVVNLGRLVRGLDELLRRALGESIEIETVISGGLWNTLVDPAQLENAVLNLAINARDAMGGQGKLTIESGNAFLDDTYAQQHDDVKAGQYVVLAVTDTGSGIPPEIMGQVFEPFFTTKPEGQGSGLGLSMVYGLVKQSGGHIKLYSEPGEGTTVRLYFPRDVSEEDVVVAQGPTGPAEGGTETILVVEDDEAVRSTAVELLGELGYRVLTAKDADAAWAILESGLPIDLLFTDVVMPGKLRSPELARKAQIRLPNLAVLFTSGYTQNAIVHGGRLDEGVELLSKPYSREELAHKVRQVLAGGRRRPPDEAAAKVPLATASMTSDPMTEAPAANERLSLLLLEDEALVRMALADMLEEMGHATTEAGKVAEARQKLASASFDVLIADVNLPDGSGKDFVVELRSRDPAIAIIVASGDDSASGGTDGFVYLPKPYDDHMLAEALDRALGQVR